MRYANDLERRRHASLAIRAQVSAQAAIKLKCLDCVCWDAAEAKACEIRTCALWAVSSKIFKREGTKASPIWSAEEVGAG